MPGVSGKRIASQVPTDYVFAAVRYGALLYPAGVIELVGGVLVLIGLQTRWAAFLCSGLMAAAYWMAHGLNDFFPLRNQGELAALYCFVFLFIAANGSGIWSVDGPEK